MTRSIKEYSQTNALRQLYASEMLQNLLQQHPGRTIRLGELVRSLGNRAFGPTLLICALPEALPIPIAGVSAVIGIPLIVFSAQLLLGFSSPWLPPWLANRTFKRKDLEKIIEQVLRYLKRFERVIRPRWQFATTPLVERFLGLLFLVLAIAITLPIPFGNMLPAIAIATISLGLIEADGVLVVVGAIAALVILVVMAGAIAALVSWAVTFFSKHIRIG
ncbi:exopolysaccharide biosynthesis protein [Altericista sp. CCNU0014]|uniref:exopolysaccharide biosynthesis protein n=1 Tax=Altericista sp. CCNU0014 TaxID=3082949 RepID=UPI00384AA8F2